MDSGNYPSVLHVNKFVYSAGSETPACRDLVPPPHPCLQSPALFRNADRDFIGVATILQIMYSYNKDLPPSFFDKVQIITSGEIMSGREVSMPPTTKRVVEYRRQMSF